MSSAKGIPSEEPEFPFVGMEHVESNTGRVMEYADSSRYTSSAPRVVAGRVLYGRLRPYLNKVFVADRDSFVSGEFIPLQPHPELDARFLMHRLLAPDFVRFAVDLNTGDRPRVKWPQMTHFSIDLPPLDEQRRIVAILEDQLSRLDAALASVKRVSRLSGQLIDAQRRLLLYPQGVSVVSLTMLAEVVNGSTPKGIADATFADESPERIPYIKVGDMNFGDGVHVLSSRTWITHEDAGRLGLRVAPTGTVIFPKRGGAIATNKKRVLARPAAFDLNTMGVVPGKDLDPAFLHMYFASVDLTSIADGSNIPQINAKGMARLRIPSLSLNAQREAVMSLEATETVASRYAAISLEGRASDLRRSLLTFAFSGRLTEESIGV